MLQINYSDNFCSSGNTTRAIMRFVWLHQDSGGKGTSLVRCLARETRQY